MEADTKKDSLKKKSWINARKLSAFFPRTPYAKHVWGKSTGGRDIFKGPPQDFKRGPPARNNKNGHFRKHVLKETDTGLGWRCFSIPGPPRTTPGPPKDDPRTTPGTPQDYPMTTPEPPAGFLSPIHTELLGCFAGIIFPFRFSLDNFLLDRGNLKKAFDPARVGPGRPFAWQ